MDLPYDEDDEEFGFAEQLAYVADEVYELRTGAKATDEDIYGSDFEFDLYDQATSGPASPGCGSGLSAFIWSTSKSARRCTGSCSPTVPDRRRPTRHSIVRFCRGARASLRSRSSPKRTRR